VRAGAGAALEQLEAAVALDLTDLRLLAALRTFVSLSHEAGNPAAADDAVKAALDAHPRSSALHEIRGLHLELSGAAREEARAAYERALELEPRNARASTGLGRLALGDDPQAALAWFDRAAAADPADAEPELGAASALAASGELDRAAERLDALLVEHPLDAQAAAERARLDLDRGIATPGTLERARRAVRFGGGPDALELLRQARAVHGEPEKAVPAGERAREPRGDAPSNG
jgi:tetratricopeptide (TPR) repeat protein